MKNPILQLVNSLHLSFLSCLAAETERICKSAPEIKGLGDARLWFQALLLTNNREEPLKNFQAMRKDVVEMIASNKELYRTVLESEALEARLESEAKK